MTIGNWQKLQSDTMGNNGRGGTGPYLLSPKYRKKVHHDLKMQSSVPAVFQAAAFLVL